MNTVATLVMMANDENEGIHLTREEVAEMGSLLALLYTFLPEDQRELSSEYLQAKKVVDQGDSLGFSHRIVEGTKYLLSQDPEEVVPKLATPPEEKVTVVSSSYLGSYQQQGSLYFRKRWSKTRVVYAKAMRIASTFMAEKKPFHNTDNDHQSLYVFHRVSDTYVEEAVVLQKEYWNSPRDAYLWVSEKYPNPLGGAYAGWIPTKKDGLLIFVRTPDSTLAYAENWRKNEKGKGTPKPSESAMSMWMLSLCGKAEAATRLQA